MEQKNQFRLNVQDSDKISPLRHFYLVRRPAFHFLQAWSPHTCSLWPLLIPSVFKSSITVIINFRKRSFVYLLAPQSLKRIYLFNEILLAIVELRQSIFNSIVFPYHWDTRVCKNWPKGQSILGSCQSQLSMGSLLLLRNLLAEVTVIRESRPRTITFQIFNQYFIISDP